MHQIRGGGPLWNAEDRRSVVSRGEHIAYQLQRDASCFPRITDLCERQEDSCPTKGQQHHNYVLYQSHGGHTLSTNDEVDTHPVELEPGKEDSAISRASTWQVKPGCRSGIQEAGQQFRMEIETGGVQAVDGTNGPMPDGPICVTSHSTAEDIHELEARSRSSSNRCAISIMESNQRQCLPTILLNREMPEQSTSGTGARASAECTSVADPALVPVLVSMSIRVPIQIPAAMDLLTNHRGEQHPLIRQGSLNLAAWLVSGDPSRQQEFQKQYPNLFLHIGEV